MRTMSDPALAVERVVIQPSVPGTEGDARFLATMLQRRIDTVLLKPVDLTVSPDEAAAAIRQAHIPDAGARVAVIGIGLGVPIASALHTQSDAVRRVVLVGGWWDMADHAATLARCWRSVPESQKRKALATAVSGRDLRSGGRVPAIPDTAIWGAALQYLGTHAPRLSGRLSGSAPTLIIGCEHDSIVPETESLKLAMSAPNGRFASVRAGHAVLAERAVPVLRLVEDHLRVRPILIGTRAAEVRV